MLIELSKKDIINLVCGCSPNYSVFDNELVKEYGEYNGSYGTWSWKKYRLEELSENELFELYLICKNSYE